MKDFLPKDSGEVVFRQLKFPREARERTPAKLRKSGLVSILQESEESHLDKWPAKVKIEPVIAVG